MPGPAAAELPWLQAAPEIAAAPAGGPPPALEKAAARLPGPRGGGKGSRRLW